MDEITEVYCAHNYQVGAPAGDPSIYNSLLEAYRGPTAAALRREKRFMLGEFGVQHPRMFFRSDAMSLQLPMVVLIDSNSYAEAELFAAVLQEKGWAIVMGESTSGMTRTQETFVLEDGSAVRLSTKSYVTAAGKDLALAGGVIPDTIIHNADPKTVGTTEGTLGDSDGTASASDDEQLMAALKYLS